jgi:hypothetical protein
MAMERGFQLRERGAAVEMEGIARTDSKDSVFRIVWVEANWLAAKDKGVVLGV